MISGRDIAFHSSPRWDANAQGARECFRLQNNNGGPEPTARFAATNVSSTELKNSISGGSVTVEVGNKHPCTLEQGNNDETRWDLLPISAASASNRAAISAPSTGTRNPPCGAN
jgi:hypothetical protein